MGDFDYTMFKHGDKTFGGVMKPMQPGTPPLWLNYVSVTDVDASFAKAKSLGATPVAGPMDIGEAGKIAVFQDPQGALIGLHQAS
jgi:predicted enzyme related to lactoylglutathione lyase